MKRATIALCLMLTACALPQEFAKIDPRPQPRTNGEIIVDVPHNRDDRVERQDGAARCAQYGRVAVRRSNGEFACVEPGNSDPKEVWRE